MRHLLLNGILEYIYVTEGNTFEVLQYMRVNVLIDYIKVLMKSER